MVVAEIKGDIVDNETRTFFSYFGCENEVFSTDVLKKLYSNNESESDFKFNIETNGGFVDDAFNAYDIIRTSGKNNFTNVIEKCHSSGVILLLSAPKENRSGNPNAKYLIHLPRTTMVNATAEEMQQATESLNACKKKILDLYVERTGQEYSVLETLMNEEKERTSTEMLQYGFISKINNYNTNLKSNQMAEMTKEVNEMLSNTEKFMNRLKNMFASKITNYAFKDSEGNVLFTTDKEDESLEVGDMATPDGTYEVNNNTIVIAGGKIESITPIADDSELVNLLRAENASLKEQIGNLKTQSENLETKVTECTNLIEESKTVITNLKATVTSNFQVPARVSTPAKVTNTAKTSEERRAEIKENRNKLKNQ